MSWGANEYIRRAVRVIVLMSTMLLGNRVLLPQDQAPDLVIEKVQFTGLIKTSVPTEHGEAMRSAGEFSLFIRNVGTLTFAEDFEVSWGIINELVVTRPDTQRIRMGRIFLFPGEGFWVNISTGSEFSSEPGKSVRFSIDRPPKSDRLPRYKESNYGNNTFDYQFLFSRGG